MKRKTVVFLVVLVVCGMTATYVTRLIVAQRSARMTLEDNQVLSGWKHLLGAYPEMQDLPSRADAARSWAKTAADEYSKQTISSGALPATCPAGVTPAQAVLICRFVSAGLDSGLWETKARRTGVTWKDVLTGSWPQRDKKPSECLDPYFFDRDELERLANNHALAELVDQFWQIGYDASCRPADDS